MTQARVSFAQQINSRTASFSKDGYSANCMFERVSETEVDCVKRPGLSLFKDLSASATGAGQGTFHLVTGGATYVFAVINNKVIRADTGAVIGTMSGPVAAVYSTEFPSDTAVIFHNGTEICWIDTTLTMYHVKQITTSPVTISIASPGVVSWAGHTLVNGDLVQFSTTGALPTGLSVGVTYFVVNAVAGVSFQVSLTRGGAAINTSGTQSGTQTATSLGFDYAANTGLAAGLIFLDNMLFIATTNGRVYNSDVGTQYTLAYTNWGALNYLQIYSDPEPLKGLLKHLNYIIAFKEESAEFMYDAGNAAPGSVLSTYPSARLTIGCSNGQSISNTLQSALWIGESTTYGKGIYLFNGLQPTKVSDRYIEKFLNSDGCTSVRAYAVDIEGHTLYVLTLMTLGITLVYDLNEKVWYRWTSWNGTSEVYFMPTYYQRTNISTNQVAPLLLGETDSKLYSMIPTVYQDNSQPIYFRSVMQRSDLGTNDRKFFGKLEVIGDKVAATLSIRHTDDDFATYSSYRTVDLSLNRPVLYQGGSARSRSYDCYSISNVPIRLRALEFNIEKGSG